MSFKFLASAICAALFCGAVSTSAQWQRTTPPFVVLQNIGDRVGINTNSPVSRLQVVGQTRTDSLWMVHTNPSFSMATGTGMGSHALSMTQNSITMAVNGVYIPTRIQQGRIDFSSGQGGNSCELSHSRVFFNINGSGTSELRGGNLDITGGPATHLGRTTISAGTLITSQVRVQPVAGQPGIATIHPSGNGAWWNIGNYSNGAKLGIKHGDMRSANDNTSWDRSTVTIMSDRVGIMTNNPQSTLAVNGTVTAKEVVVTQIGWWPDYVFRPGYELPTLEDVEKHISVKGTLPGIPSEAEVLNNGVKVGEMQARLLAKIEELTLYVIQQQKEINELRSAIKSN